MKVKDDKVSTTEPGRFLDNVYKSSSDTPYVKKTKGVLTREKILKAAIAELAYSGVKGTTHRAIATRADIQLSLTTYYFKDIQELIHHAFMLNANNILISREHTFEKVMYILTAFKKSDLRKTPIKEILFLQLVDFISTYLLKTTKEETAALAVQQLMFTEMQFNTSLRQIAIEYETSLLFPYIEICSFFNKKNPEIDANLLHTIISQLQYKVLSNDNRTDASANITLSIERIIGWIMKIKR
jgi:AcrR family transcriptional regulator